MAAAAAARTWRTRTAARGSATPARRRPWRGALLRDPHLVDQRLALCDVVKCPKRSQLRKDAVSLLGGRSIEALQDEIKVVFLLAQHLFTEVLQLTDQDPVVDLQHAEAHHLAGKEGAEQQRGYRQQPTCTLSKRLEV